ncbi:Hypothetical_protein [Hexamita inflata]|uniref:Hypothetical_protein n=1 Tax=Hexamita inflata TaxID=28002 RepID=A0AA86QUK7_9EUKA|nr:Hypothetical protein HINF_LOCUS47573 [Hexamita inflata]
MIRINIFTEKLDKQLLEAVAKQIKYQGEIDGVPIYYQYNKDKLPNVDWYEIDRKLDVESYPTKARSQHRFLNVFIPNALPEYDPELQEEISVYVQQQLKKEQGTWQTFNKKQRDNYRKNLEDQVKTKFSLSADDMCSYKKLVDKNRHKINHIMNIPSKPDAKSSQNKKQIQKANSQDVSSKIQTGYEGSDWPFHCGE